MFWSVFFQVSDSNIIDLLMPTAWFFSEDQVIPLTTESDHWKSLMYCTENSSLKLTLLDLKQSSNENYFHEVLESNVVM